MATVYIRTNPQPSRVGTSRTVVVPTSPATFIISLSGYMGWGISNVGNAAVAYGDSSVTAGTGSLQFYSMEQKWYPIADTMSMYVIADSIAGIININDYL